MRLPSERIGCARDEQGIIDANSRWCTCAWNCGSGGRSREQGLGVRVRNEGSGVEVEVGDLEFWDEDLRTECYALTAEGRGLRANRSEFKAGNECVGFRVAGLGFRA